MLPIKRIYKKVNEEFNNKIVQFLRVFPFVVIELRIPAAYRY